MTTDHNEAMRLADELDKWARDYATTDYTDAMATKAAALIRKQATARALDTFAHNVMAAQARLEMVQLTNKLRNVEGQRDTLRAEVERLKREKAHAIDKAGHMLAAGMGLSNCALNLKQRVGEPLSTHDVAALESSQRAWDTAIDTARKATQ